MKSITRTGDRLAYQTYGSPDAPSLLLLHGLGADHDMWAPQIESYSTRGYRLLVPDLRGHGESVLADPGTIADWVEDLKAILDVEGVREYGLLGVSMGGIIAQGLALADRERLRGLVLCDTFMDLERVGERLLGWTILQSLRVYRILGREQLAKLTTSPYKSSPRAAKYFYDATTACNVRQIVRARKAINRVAHKDNLAHLDVPTLHLVGEAAGAYFVELNRKVSETMPDSTLVVLPGGTDPSNLVVPELFDEQVLPFLERVFPDTGVAPEARYGNQ